MSNIKKYALYRVYPYDDEGTDNDELLTICDTLEEAYKQAGILHKGDMNISKINDEYIISNNIRPKEEEERLLEESPYDYHEDFEDDYEYCYVEIRELTYCRPREKPANDAIYIKTLRNIVYLEKKEVFKYGNIYNYIHTESKYLQHDLNYISISPDHYSYLKDNTIIIEYSPSSVNNESVYINFIICTSDFNKINSYDDYIDDFLKDSIKDKELSKDKITFAEFIFNTFDNTKREFKDIKDKCYV